MFGLNSRVDATGKKTAAPQKRKAAKQVGNANPAVPSLPAQVPPGDLMLFEETFQQLSRGKWWATRGSWNDRFGEGKPYDGSGVTFSDREATLRADRTDQVGILYSAPIPVSKGARLVIRRQVFVHAANRTFGGGMQAFEVSDPSLSPAKPDFTKHLFTVTYNNFEKGTDLNCFSLQCGTNVPEGPGTHAGGKAPKTAPIWDQWFAEEIVYDSGSGDTSYCINGEEKMRALGAPLKEPFIKILFHPYGWGTGHFMKMQSFQVIQLVGKTQVTVTTGCTGLPPLTFDRPKDEVRKPEPPKPQPPTSGDTAKTGSDADRARELHELGVAMFPASAGNSEARRSAIQRLAEAVRLDPTVDAYRIDFADALLHDNNDLGILMGIELFEEMLAADPTSDAALGRVVYGLVELGNVDGALNRLAKRAKDSRPLPFSLASSLTSLAVTHGKAPRVAAILRQAHRQAPGDDMISVYLAVIERELGNGPAANEILIVVAKGPAESVPAAYARAMLQEVPK